MNEPSNAAAVAAEPTQAVERALYEIRKKIYPRAVTGSFATARWVVVFLTQAVFYGLPWLNWNGRQAVLFDLASRKFYIFGLVFWPQDIVYLTILLIISALALFLFTAVAGRLWCGYACPQTVYTEIFMWIEERVEGGHMARKKLDKEPVSARKLRLKATKHGLWIALALWTGFTFVGYFTPIRTLWGEVWSASLGGWQMFWILFYGFATYGNAGWMREQVCKYMCPYARFQGVMFDPDTLIITYDDGRGEPRGARSKAADHRARGLGDCVDCGICVQVCPTGIDIRNGLQYECIGCGACIDGCNQVMDKMGYPKGLIRYSTEHAVKQRLDGKQIAARMLRPRVLLYCGIVAAIVVAALVTLVERVPVKVDVIRDRASLARDADELVAENVYRLQIMNTDEVSREFTISVAGLEDMKLICESQPIQVAGASNRVVPVRVQVEREEAKAGSNRIEFTFRAVEPGKLAAPPLVIRETATFVVDQGRRAMNEREQRVDAGPWYREPWPWILMSAPAAAVIGGTVTAYLAVTHQDPLVVDSYYKEGLAINRVLERDQAAKLAGYRAQVLVSEDGSRVRVHLSAHSALPGKLRLRMIHPTRAELDREVVLPALQAGWYEGGLALAPASRWSVQLEDDQRGWRLTGDWRTAEGGAIRLEPRS